MANTGKDLTAANIRYLLALRDLDDPPITEENYDEVMERMNEYLGEFQRHGTDHVTVEMDD